MTLGQGRASARQSETELSVLDAEPPSNIVCMSIWNVRTARRSDGLSQVYSKIVNSRIVKQRRIESIT